MAEQPVQRPVLAKAAGAPVALECRRSRVRLVAVQRARRTFVVHSSPKCTPPAIRAGLRAQEEALRCDPFWENLNLDDEILHYIAEIADCPPPPRCRELHIYIYTYVIDRLYTFVSSPLSPCCSYLRDTLRGSLRYFRRRLRLVARPGLRPRSRCSGSDVTVCTRYNGGTTRGAAQGSRLMPQDAGN